MKYKPLRDQVLVELDPMDETFGDSDLVRPYVAKDRQIYGTVKAVGSGRVTKKGALVPNTVTPGQRVIVPWSTGHDLYIGGKHHVSIHDSDIVATVEE